MGIDSGTLDATADLATEDKQIEILDAIKDSSGFPSTDVEPKGLQTVGTTPVQLVFSGTTKVINITAGEENLGRIYIGKSDVDSTGANAIDMLFARSSYTEPYDDSTNPLYVVASIADQEYVAGAPLAPVA